jgi:hypothetical protein
MKTMENEISLTNAAIKPILLKIRPPKGKSLDEIIPEKEYLRMLGWMVKRPEGGYWKKERVLKNSFAICTGFDAEEVDEYHFLLHPSHVAALSRLAKRIGIEPYIVIQQ